MFKLLWKRSPVFVAIPLRSGGKRIILRRRVHYLSTSHSLLQSRKLIDLRCGFEEEGSDGVQFHGAQSKSRNTDIQEVLGAGKGNQVVAHLIGFLSPEMIELIADGSGLWDVFFGSSIFNRKNNDSLGLHLSNILENAIKWRQ